MIIYMNVSEEIGEAWRKFSHDKKKNDGITVSKLAEFALFTKQSPESVPAFLEHQYRVETKNRSQAQNNYYRGVILTSMLPTYRKICRLKVKRIYTGY